MAVSAQDRRTQERRRSKVSISAERRRKDRRIKERRETPRIPLELWMEEMSGDDVYFRRTGNVSEGGAYFDRAIPHPLGTVVTLKFALPGDKEMVVARGEVVNAADATKGLGMGIRFVSIEGDGRKRLRAFVRTQ